MSMFLAKLKLVVAVVLVLGGLGLAGVTSWTGKPAQARADPTPAAKPQNELDRLRRENELLKLNLEVVLEKVRAQEAEIRTLKGRSAEQKAQETMPKGGRIASDQLRRTYIRALADVVAKAKDPLKQVEDALKALRAAPDKKSMGKAAEELDRAIKQLHEHMKQGKSLVPQQQPAS